MILLSQKVLPVTSPDIDNGAIVVKDGVIIAVGRQRDILRAHKDPDVIDFGRAVLMPGLVNTHTHLELSHLHGLTGEKEHFCDWIQEFVTLKRKLGIKGAARAAADALAEAVDSGTTCIGDISGTDLAVPAILKMNIRAVLFIEVLGLDDKTAGASYKNFTHRLQDLAGRPKRISVGVSPHSPYSVSTKLYNNIKAHLSSHDLAVAVHLSESIDEHLHLKGMPSKVDGYMERFGWTRARQGKYNSPLQFLKEMGLHKGLLAVHAVHVSKGDMVILKRSGASVAHCPRSNHFLRVGKAPVEEMMARGINVALGTDSLASNLDLNFWEEMRFAYLVNRLTARQVIDMATINGARALGLDPVTGSLEPGKKADLIAVETSAAKAKEPCLPLLMEGGKGNVIFSMVDGKIL